MPFQSSSFENRGGHTSVTFTDPYSGATKHTETEAQKQAYLNRARDRRLQQDLSRYDQNAFKYRDDLLRQFGEQANFGAGMATGGVMAGVNQFLQRRGIDPRRSGIAASLQSQQQGQLQAQAAGAKLNFSGQLMQAMQQNRDAVLVGTLNFFQAMDRMNYQNELNKDLARFQGELQKDVSRWNALGSVLGLGGRVLAGLFGPSNMPDTSQLPGEMQTADPIPYLY